jgi:uncharacterized membrane protein
MVAQIKSKKSAEQDRPVASTPRSASVLPVSRRLDLPFVVLTLIGIGISGYLAWAHFTYTPILCTADLSCDTVNRSAYAYFPPNWGIPVSYLGLLAYTGLLALGLWRWRTALAGVSGGSTSWLDLILFVATLVGLIFSAYLTAMELFVIHAICWWCVGSAIIITLLFGIAVARVWMGNDY